MYPIVSLVFGLLLVSLLTPFGLYKLRKHYFRKERFGKEYINSTAFSLFNTMYAFFVGFSIVTLWGTFATAKNSVTMEAGAVQGAVRLSLPLERSDAFRLAMGRYIQSVVQVEWPIMEASDQLSPQTELAFEQVWAAYATLKPRDKQDNTLYANVGSMLAKAAELRSLRATYLSGNLYPLIWTILVVGFCAVLASLFVINSTNDPSKIIMECFLVFLFLSCIYLVYDIATPYSGIVKVEPMAFVDLMQSAVFAATPQP